MAKVKTVWYRDKEVLDWLSEITGVDPEYTRRVIIDFAMNDVIRVYIERLADNKMFKIKTPHGLDESIEIVTLDKE